IVDKPNNAQIQHKGIYHNGTDDLLSKKAVMNDQNCDLVVFKGTNALATDIMDKPNDAQIQHKGIHHNCMDDLLAKKAVMNDQNCDLVIFKGTNALSTDVQNMFALEKTTANANDEYYAK
ncbi:hypothetical protein KI387_024448, partial [Taxus chinensis]